MEKDSDSRLALSRGSRKLVGYAVIALMIVTAVSCGHKYLGSGLPPPPEQRWLRRLDAPTGQSAVGAHSYAPAPGGSRTAPTIPLADVLKQVDAYQPPKDIDAARFTALKTELKRLLTARANLGGRGADRAATQAGAIRTGGRRSVVAGKSISIAPVGTMNAVTDLAATVNPAGTQATLTWTEVLPGDYDNDGTVDAGDLVPIAQHYMQRTDTGPDDAHKLVVGDSDPEVNIADIQAISNNYAAQLQGYQVWRGRFTGTFTLWEPAFRPNANASNPKWSANRPSPPPVGTRPSYTYVDDIVGAADVPAVRYMVVAYGDAAQGAGSNEATVPLPPPMFSVSGKVTESGVGLAGVTVTLTPGGMKAPTQANGSYTMIGVAEGSYTLTPTLAGHVFWPENRSVSVSGADETGQDFTARPQTYSVSGTVTDLAVGLAGVTMTLTPDGSMAWTQADGSYTISGVANGSYTLTPTATGIVFTPASVPVTVNAANVVGLDFTAIGGLADTAWPKFRGNAQNTGLSPYVGAQTNHVKWSSATGGYAETSPAIGVNGTIYVGSDDGNLNAIQPADGSVIWKYFTGALVRSCPAVGADGTVYVGCYYNNIVCALNSPDGSVKWSYATGVGAASPPAIVADGTVYIGRGSTLFAINPSDGSAKWWHTTGDAVQSSPAIGTDGTVYIGSNDHNVYALNPSDGSVEWMYATGGAVWNSPTIGADGTIYVGSGDGNVYALNPSDGSVKWSRAIASGYGVTSSSGVGPDGTVYVGSSDSKVYALSPADGSVKWSHTTGWFVESSPAIGADGTVYFGSDDWKVYALNPSDGTLKWSYATGQAVQSSPAIGVDGTVYIGSNDGKLYAFGP